MSAHKGLNISLFDLLDFYPSEILGNFVSSPYGVLTVPLCGYGIQDRELTPTNIINNY